MTFILIPVGIFTFYVSNSCAKTIFRYSFIILNFNFIYNLDENVFIAMTP